MSAADQTVVVFEVGPRDGPQNERRLISVADKINLIDQLARCGLRKIESASFVSPKWVPQMADAAQVMGGIRRCDGVAYTALTPNLKGFEAAKEARRRRGRGVCLSLGRFLSEEHQLLDRREPRALTRWWRRPRVLPRSRCAAMSPASPIVPTTDRRRRASVARVAPRSARSRLLRGEPRRYHRPWHAGRRSARCLMRCFRSPTRARSSPAIITTRGGMALANIEVSLDAACAPSISSVGGLGGCPFAPGAKGNVATEARRCRCSSARASRPASISRKLADGSRDSRTAGAA